MRAAPAMIGTYRVPDKRRLRVEVQADLFGDYDITASLIEWRGAKQVVLAQQSFCYNADGLGGEWAILCLDDVAELLRDLFTCHLPRK